MRKIAALILAALLLSLLACAKEEYESYEETSEDMEYVEAGEASEKLATAGGDIQTALPQTNGSDTDTDARPVDQRKIIYNASVDLVVDDFADVPGKVQALAKKYDGFIADSSIRGSEGEPRHGRWTLRIPSSKYDDFIAGSKSLGQVREITTGTREVTAEFVDIEARLRNLRAEEQRLNRHLEESTGKLEDILKVEREISRVRGEIERHQGRLNVLKDLTSLSTVTLSVEEIKDYVPEPTEEPGYGTRVARTWGDSLGMLGDFLTNLSLGIVALAPWLVIIAPIGVVIWIVIRRLIRKVRKALTDGPQPTA